MKIITLLMSTMVAGVLRQPIEGSLIVSDEEAERLFENNLLTGEPEDLPEQEEEEPVDPELVKLKAMSAADLKALALKEGAALNDATTKEDIAKAILAHRAKSANA